MPEPIHKPFYKSKTLWFNILIILILVIEYFLANQLFQDYYHFQALGILVINAVLRLFFTEAKLDSH